MDNQKCISSVCATVLTALGIALPDGIAAPNDELTELVKGSQKAVIYNPDAVAWWLYEKYPQMFDGAKECSEKIFRLRSVMPSVTPVCFATMYTGIMPEKHGIMKYEKPVLTVDTMFDYLIKAGKKPAIVSTEGDSISKIFLERGMDYFIYKTKLMVNLKAEQLIRSGRYDVIVIYNGDYDGTMHANGPEHRKSLNHLKQNVATYSKLVRLIKNTYKDEKVFYGFCPDHGCHEIDGKRGSHGLEMEEDMNVIHLYGTN